MGANRSRQKQPPPQAEQQGPQLAYNPERVAEKLAEQLAAARLDLARVEAVAENLLAERDAALARVAQLENAEPDTPGRTVDE